MNAKAIFDRVISHAQASGRFETVNGREPKSAPASHLSAAVWVDEIGPVPPGSGLAATAARVVLNLRIYSSMIAEPQDAIDPEVVAATDALITLLSADFTLGGTVKQIDLLGATGDPLRARAGYLTIDQSIYRVMTITIPTIVNDAWPQAG